MPAMWSRKGLHAVIARLQSNRGNPRYAKIDSRNKLSVKKNSRNPGLQ